MGSLQALGGLIVPETYLWHDYESFGADPRRDRPAQFAAIRTDADLNPIGSPLMLHCQPAPDFLPDPQAERSVELRPGLALHEAGNLPALRALAGLPVDQAPGSPDSDGSLRSS